MPGHYASLVPLVDDNDAAKIGLLVAMTAFAPSGLIVLLRSFNLVNILASLLVSAALEFFVFHNEYSSYATLVLTFVQLAGPLGFVLQLVMSAYHALKEKIAPSTTEQSTLSPYYPMTNSEQPVASPAFRNPFTLLWEFLSGMNRLVTLVIYAGSFLAFGTYYCTEALQKAEHEVEEFAGEIYDKSKQLTKRATNRLEEQAQEVEHKSEKLPVSSNELAARNAVKKTKEAAAGSAVDVATGIFYAVTLYPVYFILADFVLALGQSETKYTLFNNIQGVAALLVLIATALWSLSKYSALNALANGCIGSTVAILLMHLVVYGYRMRALVDLIAPRRVYDIIMVANAQAPYMYIVPFAFSLAIAGALLHGFKRDQPRPE